jgi:hypothetical protein
MASLVDRCDIIKGVKIFRFLLHEWRSLGFKTESGFKSERTVKEEGRYSSQERICSSPETS